MKGQEWIISNDRLFVTSPNGTSIALEQPVKRLIPLEKNVIVLLDEGSNRNVIALDNQGRTIWRIKEHPWTKYWYTSGYPSGENVVLYNAAGFELTVDPATGNFLGQEQTR